jgi:hypothetical protein
MKKPDIRSTLRDEQHNMTYHVVAFRKLNELEMVETVKLYLAQPRILRRKTPERNKTVTTHALMGSELAYGFAVI